MPTRKKKIAEAKIDPSVISEIPPETGKTPFAVGPTTMDDAERYTSVLMYYMAKHPNWSIVEVLHRTLPERALDNQNAIGKLALLLDSYEQE